MKKSVFITLIGCLCLLCANMFTTSAAAQSPKDDLIDSPSHVLNNTIKDTKKEVIKEAVKEADKPKQPKTSTPKKNDNLKRQGRLVYVSLQFAPTLDWYSNIERPFDRKGVRVAVNPSVLVDFDMGYYIFLETGLSYNTTGGRLAFPTEYINEHSPDGFSAYDNVLRAYAASYLELPIVFKVQSQPSSKGWSFFGSFGAHFGVLVHSKYIDTYEDFKYQNPSDPNSPSIEGDLIYKDKLGDMANLWSISGVFKTGASYSINKSFSVNLGIGYHLGFLDALTKHHEQPRGVRPYEKAQQFEIFIGFTF